MDKISQLIKRRVEKIYPSKKALEKVLRSGKKIRLYQGFDPSTANLHIGHLVGLLKLKEFQELGHEVIFLIGDFTGMVGDPTGKVKARKALTRKQVLKNARTYQEQAGKILRFTGKNPVKLLFNSSWLGKFKAADLLGIAGKATVQQMITRDMFQKRIKEGQDLFLNEFFYPLLQAYDSVHMDVDLEIGGSDQMFNMMVGRDLMKKLKNKEKFVLTTKLLLDSKGEKIGKTEGNVINIAQPPSQLFGQIMSLADDCILPCFELITEVPMERVGETEKALKSGENPMRYKKELAFELVKMLNNENIAKVALSHFEKVFEKREEPIKMRGFNLGKGKINVVDLLVETGFAESRSLAKRLIAQGTVSVDQATVKDLKMDINIPKQGRVLKVGKKREFLKILP